MYLSNTGKIAVMVVILCVSLRFFTCCFLWDKLPIRRGKIRVNFFDKIHCKVNVEWIEEKFVNPPPFQSIGGGIPVFGVVEIKYE